MFMVKIYSTKLSNTRTYIFIFYVCRCRYKDTARQRSWDTRYMPSFAHKRFLINAPHYIFHYEAHLSWHCAHNNNWGSNSDISSKCSMGTVIVVGNFARKLQRILRSEHILWSTWHIKYYYYSLMQSLVSLSSMQPWAVAPKAKVIDLPVLHLQGAQRSTEQRHWPSS